MLATEKSYNAINRIRRQSMPDTSRIKYIYNKAGLPEKMMLKQNGTSTFVEYITNINYNEKGQRTEIYYANSSKTKYEYDTETFRLTRLLTTHSNF